MTNQFTYQDLTDLNFTFRPYNRENALAYARRWALDRNPLYPNYAGIGGDCTNFVSQCILAGSCYENFTQDFGWYFISPEDRAPAWTSVEYFYDFLTGAPDFRAENGGYGPFGTEVARRGAIPGDVVQLADADGDFYHSLFICDVENGEIYVCAHTNDALNRPLSDYNYAYNRFIHVEGVRIPSVYPCFEKLIGGISLPDRDMSPKK